MGSAVIIYTLLVAYFALFVSGAINTGQSDNKLEKQSPQARKPRIGHGRHHHFEKENEGDFAVSGLSFRGPKSQGGSAQSHHYRLRSHMRNESKNDQRFDMHGKVLSTPENMDDPKNERAAIHGVKERIEGLQQYLAALQNKGKVGESDVKPEVETFASSQDEVPQSVATGDVDTKDAEPLDKDDQRPGPALNDNASAETMTSKSSHVESRTEVSNQKPGTGVTPRQPTNDEMLKEALADVSIGDAFVGLSWEHTLKNVMKNGETFDRYDRRKTIPAIFKTDPNISPELDFSDEALFEDAKNEPPISHSSKPNPSRKISKPSSSSSSKKSPLVKTKTLYRESSPESQSKESPYRVSSPESRSQESSSNESQSKESSKESRLRASSPESNKESQSDESRSEEFNKKPLYRASSPESQSKESSKRPIYRESSPESSSKESSKDSRSKESSKESRSKKSSEESRSKESSKDSRSKESRSKESSKESRSEEESSEERAQFPNTKTENSSVSTHGEKNVLKLRIAIHQNPGLVDTLSSTLTHGPPPFRFEDIQSKFNEYKEKLKGLVTKVAPSCPELLPLKLVQAWAKTFRSAWPNFKEMLDTSLKYAEDLKLQLVLCLDTLAHKKFGKILGNTARKNSEESLDAEGQKVKRELEDQRGQFVSTFNSDLINPLVNMFAKMPEMVHNANSKK